MTDLTSNVKGEEIDEVICLYELGLGKDLPRAPGRAGQSVGSSAGRVQAAPSSACIAAGNGGACSEAQGERCPGARCSPRRGERTARRASSETTLVLLSDVLFVCNMLNSFTGTYLPDNKLCILLKMKKSLLCVECFGLCAVLFNVHEATTPAFFLLTVRP